VQAIYLVVFIGVALALAVPIILWCSTRYGRQDPRTQLAIALTAGSIGSLIIVSLRADLVPDSLESVLRLVLIPVGTVVLVWLGWLVLRLR
jgi:hypothetical protein